MLRADALHWVYRWVAAILVATFGVVWSLHWWPFRHHEERSRITISVDAKGECYYSDSDLSVPRKISCAAMSRCLDKQIDPVSDACLTK